ncbi:hypothetical protein [Spirillospora sp. NPDC048823]|uniref:hypothetical protein n=1 Tax=unclassified Spirillospora TaxID=2642701 RepID=UPI0037176AC7
MPEAALRELVLDTAPRDAGLRDAVQRDAVQRDAGLRDTVPVLPALHPVLPGGLRPGSVIGLGGSGPASPGSASLGPASLGSASLGSALVAGVSLHGGEEGTGGWCGVVGLPGFGVAAAAGMGAAPERLLLVDDPGDRWPDVVAALCEAVDLVLLCPPERPGAAAVRRLSALARKHGCVLTLTGAFARDWPGTRLRLRLDDVDWEGLADGHGRLTGRRVQIVAEGRDAPGPGRRARVWLPAPDGTVQPDETVRPPLELVPEPVAEGGRGHPRTSTLPPRVRVPAEEGIA